MKYCLNGTIRKYGMLKKTMILSVLLSVMLNFPIFAGQWQKDNEGLWKYLQEEGGYVKNGWHQIAGIWYSFDENGIMRMDTVTPDGYVVGFDGSCIDSVGPQDRVLKLEEEGTVLGKLKKVRYNSVYYESTKEVRVAYILELPYSVTIYDGMGLAYGGNAYREIQLASDELYSDNYNDKNVVVTGVTFEGLTGWYIRDIAMMIENIKVISE